MSAEVRKDLACLGALLLLGAAGFAFLPSLGADVFASPDETAVFEVSRRFASGQTAARPEVLAEEYPWLHPRSWVSQGQRIVPVGFLGWPWLLQAFVHFGKAAVPFAASFFILSSVVPLFFLLKRFGRVPALFGGLVYLSYPPLLLYGNRSLFPNAPVLAFALWSAWAMTRETWSRAWLKHLFIGVASGAVFAIRPVEAMWIIPWWIVAGWSWRPDRKMLAYVAGGLALVVLPVLFHAQLTYGAFWKSGYVLADNPAPASVTIIPSTDVPAPDPTERYLPYGFHPRAIASNSRSFLFGYAWPWTLLALAGAAFAISNWKKWNRRGQLTAGATVWTTLVLLAVYGSGTYTDNINPGAVTIGNSFLRYLLPLSVACAFSAALLASHPVFKQGRARLAGFGLVLALAGFGVWKAFAGDNESILAVRPELKRYAVIRAAASEWFSSSDVILSERSDKIFFPAYRAVSPLPPSEEVGRLVRSADVKVGLFVRPMSQKDRDAWRSHGVEPIELASYGRERLYLLRPNGL